MTVTNLATGGNPGGCLRGIATADAFAIEPGTFMATGYLATANFVGDYSAAGVELLGFDIRTLYVPDPASVAIKLSSGASSVSHDISDRIASSGTWYSVRLPLVGPFVAGWYGSTNLFANIMTNVTRVEITIARHSSLARTCFLDNIFLDRLHNATEASPVDTNDVLLTWNNLRIGDRYRLEAAPQITTNAWTELSAFTATDSLYQVHVNSTNLSSCYRLMLE